MERGSMIAASWPDRDDRAGAGYLPVLIKVALTQSSCPQPGIVGIARVVSGTRPDPTQFDANSPYCDPASKPELPRWLLLDVRALSVVHRSALLPSSGQSIANFNPTSLPEMRLCCIAMPARNVTARCFQLTASSPMRRRSALGKA